MVRNRNMGLLDYLQTLDYAGLLTRVTATCDPHLEMGEIAHRVLQREPNNRTLLFERSGTEFPVAMNLFASTEHMLRVLYAESYEEIAERFSQLVAHLTAPNTGLAERVRKISTVRRLHRYRPRIVTGKAASQEVVQEKPDLRKLPITQSWPYDGGPFLTLPMVITQDPDTGQRNVGMYRMQMIDGQTTGMHWHIHKTGAKHYRKYKARGERMPVAVALGGDPLLAYCATAPLPEGIDEWLLAGFLRKQHVALTRAKSVDLLVPSEADFIIEGYVDPAEELLLEGPFGDHTGFYSLEDYYPKFHITAITHRKDAIYPATIVGIPPMEDAYIAEATERIFLPLLQLTLSPEIVDLALPTAGVAHNLAIVAMHTEYPGQGERVANLFWGTGQLMFTKYIVAVDSEIDPHDTGAVLSAIARNTTTVRQLLFGRGPLDALDHASTREGVGGKLFIDARSVAPTAHLAPESIRWEKIPQGAAFQGQTLWVGSTALLTVLPFAAARSAEAALQWAKDLAKPPRCLALIDEAFPLESPYLLLWHLLANSSPEGEYCQTVEAESGFTLFIDCRSKTTAPHPRPWPNIVVSTPDTIAQVDKRWAELGCGALIPSPSKPLIHYPIGSSARIPKS